MTKLFTHSQDIVLDPFLGSGTTALAAQRLNRRYIGIELKKEYFERAQAEINADQPLLLDRPQFTKMPMVASSNGKRV